MLIYSLISFLRLSGQPDLVCFRYTKKIEKLCFFMSSYSPWWHWWGSLWHPTTSSWKVGVTYRRKFNVPKCNLGTAINSKHCLWSVVFAVRACFSALTLSGVGQWNLPLTHALLWIWISALISQIQLLSLSFTLQVTCSHSHLLSKCRKTNATFDRNLLWVLILSEFLGVIHSNSCTLRIVTL